MLCAEYWAFEILIVLAGIIGVTELAAQTVCLMILALAFEITVGFQQAVCAVLGNCTGANNVALAERFFSVTMKLNLAVTITISILLVLARAQIASVFTDSVEVREQVARVLIIGGFMFLFDGTQGFLQGPIRARGL